MSDEMSGIGEVEAYYINNGKKKKYRIELVHRGLNKHRLIKGDFPDVIRRKALVQMQEWKAKWEEKERRQREAERKAKKEETAESRTKEAQDVLASLHSILEDTLGVDDTVDWDSVKDHSGFSDAPVEAPTMPEPPKEPSPTDPDLRAQLSFYHHLIPPLKRKRLDEAQARFRNAYDEWKESMDAHAREVASLEQRYSHAQKAWEARKTAFEADQQAANAAIDELKTKYGSADPDAVSEYCELVLSRSDYPDYFPQEFDLAYNPETRIVVVDYLLPAPEDLPTLKEVKYIKSHNEMREKHLSERELNQLYDNVLYQVALRTVHELFEADQIKALDCVAFNGIVRTIDRGTGQRIEPCVLSLQAQRDEFLVINLRQVEPKQCFKTLKGVGSSKLHSITPVAPIIQLDKEDARFVEGRDVSANIDERTNLAAIDWEDFEHLIRSLFEEEFASDGGEVKVTQASRDGGVDAVAFDPDPIRGGKIVIQAKRYTNTVGVAAVRDLYGTVMNEGATKGILVTTSDYGPDAYSFARDKPLTLLNGSNLLHLLGKHGHRAKIDLKEAKRLASERDA